MPMSQNMEKKVDKKRRTYEFFEKSDEEDL
jgi:hypothetical protein